MPLGRKDADRGLELLWEFQEKTEDEQQRSAYVEAISSLHAYLTDLLPASQPLLRAKAIDGFVEIRPLNECPHQTARLHCTKGEKLGISIDSVSVCEWASSEVSPFVVSLVKPGSVADRDGTLRRGDQLLEVNGRPLLHVSLDRAR